MRKWTILQQLLQFLSENRIGKKDLGRRAGGQTRRRKRKQGWGPNGGFAAIQANVHGEESFVIPLLVLWESICRCGVVSKQHSLSAVPRPR